MKLILIGSEYAGKTTLANEITTWLIETMGSGRTFHDHFTIPPSELPEAEQERIPEDVARTSSDVSAILPRVPSSSVLLQRPRPYASWLSH